MPANTPVQNFLHSSNLATVLTDIANAAVLQRTTDGQTAVENYLHQQNLSKGITNLSLTFSIGTNPSLSTVLNVTVHTALGLYTVSTCVRSLPMNPSHPSWRTLQTTLDTLHQTMTKRLVTAPPHHQTVLDGQITTILQQYKQENRDNLTSEISSLLHAYQLALSLAIMKAGAAHTNVSLPVYVHALLYTTANVNPSSSVTFPTLPRPSFALVQGNLQDASTWFVQKYIYLTCSIPENHPSTYVENLNHFVKTFTNVRTKLGPTNVSTHTVDGTLIPLGNPPANRWTSLDEILKLVVQESTPSTADSTTNSSLVFPVSIDFNAEKTYLSLETLKKEAEAIAAAEAAYLAAGNKPKPAPKPVPAKPPAKGALPPDPSTLWAIEPLTISLPDGSPSEEGQAKFIMAKPTPEAVTAAPNPEAARLTLSALRYSIVLKDCFRAYPRLGTTIGSLCIDPIDVTDEYTWSVLAQQCKENNLVIRLASRQCGKLCGDWLKENTGDGSSTEGMEKMLVEKLNHLSGILHTIILSFDDIPNVSGLLHAYRTLSSVLPSTTIALDHSFYLADNEGIEGDVTLGAQCSDILLPTPEHNASINIVARLTSIA